ncbi:MAG: TIM barrel protein, partial [Clostridia bacterium]
MTKEELLTRRLFAFNQLLPIIEGTDNYLCLENLVTIIPHSEELVETIEATNSKNVGICFDCGHLNIGNQWSYQETQQHFFDVCGKYIRALHVADNDGRTDQHLIPVAIDNCDMRKNYTTKVDIYELVRLLKSIN